VAAPSRSHPAALETSFPAEVEISSCASVWGYLSFTVVVIVDISYTYLLWYLQSASRTNRSAPKRAKLFSRAISRFQICGYRHFLYQLTPYHTRTGYAPIDRWIFWMNKRSELFCGPLINIYLFRCRGLRAFAPSFRIEMRNREAHEVVWVWSTAKARWLC